METANVTRVWILTSIYEDEPYEVPGILIGRTPGEAVNNWLQDMLGGITVDTQGFPVHEDETHVARVWMREVGYPLLEDARRDEGWRTLKWDGCVWHLQSRELDTTP